MSGIFTLLNKLGILAAARKLSWSEQTAYTAKPGSATDGVSTSGSLFTSVLVQVREQPAYRTTRITFGAFDGVSAYTVTLNGGTPVAIADGSDIADTVADAVQTLNDNVNSNTIITAFAEVRNGVQTLVLKGKAEADYTCVVGVSSGTGTIAADLDATEATLKLFAQPDASGINAPSPWSAFPNGEFAVTKDNFLERFRTAGSGRFYAQVAFTGGSGKVYHGPGIEE